MTLSYHAVVDIIHLLSNPRDAVERKSISSLSRLRQYGFRYIQSVNPPYQRAPPDRFCLRPELVSAKAGSGVLGPGHYGCFLAHKSAITTIDPLSIQLVLICERDAILTCSPRKFVRILNRVLELEKDIAYISFGNHPKKLQRGPRVNEWACSAQEQYWTHCYAIPSHQIPFVKEKFLSVPWDTIDFWYNHALSSSKRIISDRAYCVQGSGYSWVDRLEKKKSSIFQQRMNNEWFDAMTLLQPFKKHLSNIVADIRKLPKLF